MFIFFLNTRIFFGLCFIIQVRQRIELYLKSKYFLNIVFLIWLHWILISKNQVVCLYRLPGFLKTLCMKMIVKRLPGYFLDLVISFVCYFGLFMIAGLALSLFDLNQGVSLQLKKYLNSISSFQDQLYTYLAFFIFLMFQDIVLKNNAVSRRILKLQLVNIQDRSYPQFKNLVIRNLVKALFIPDLV